MLIVVSSPSGGGKGTLIRRVLQTVPNLSFSVSYTTRDAREGEVDGREYHFVSVERFKHLQAEGEFLEWAVVHGNFYGTGRSQILRDVESGKDIVLEVDVQGAESLRDFANGTIEIFIIPPSFEELRSRLASRGTESPNELETRLRNSRYEMEQYRKFDYVVLNDDVDRASSQLASIIYAERAKRKRQADLAQSVLDTFPEYAAGSTDPA